MKVKQIQIFEVMECIKNIFIAFVCQQYSLILFLKFIVCKWFLEEYKYIVKEEGKINKCINNDLKFSSDDNDSNEEISNEETSMKRIM